MMNRRRFMARTSVAIDGLVTDLGLDPSERGDVQRRMTRYNRECGCALGGATMAVALGATAAYMTATATIGIVPIVVAAGVVFASSLLGKAAGLAVASLRLELLRRSLERRKRGRRGSRVYVY